MLHMMRNLEIERLTLAAMSIGIARRSLEIMNRYATEREAFGKSLNHFGQVQRYIADSYAEYKAARAYVYETARRMELNKEGNRLDSDGVKLVATTMAKNVADRAIQVLGGYGYVGEYVVEIQRKIPCRLSCATLFAQSINDDFRHNAYYFRYCSAFFNAQRRRSTNFYQWGCCCCFYARCKCS
jgi:hypothetical protein